MELNAVLNGLMYVQGSNRVDKTLNYNEPGAAFVSIWPVGKENQTVLRDEHHVTRITFIGESKGFTPGSILKGVAKVIRSQDRQKEDKSPRFAVDEHTQPILDEKGEPIIEQALTIRWDALQRERAIPADEIVKDVKGLDKEAAALREE